MDALVGFTGFVGSTLTRQARFGSVYRSTNIDQIIGQSFDTLVCAGAPAQKWLANLDPESDRRKIESLIAHLESIQCKTFILISTVDVFKNPVGVDESVPVDEHGLHAYGLHRRLLETFVASHFPRHLIVRLPGLVGPGLRKNVIFDLLHNNDLKSIDSRGIFQFYPMVNLWYDIQTALEAGLKLIHLTAEPISVADVSLKGFGKTFVNTLESRVGLYDMQTNHAKLFGGTGRYQYSTKATIQAVRHYAQSEPHEFIAWSEVFK